MNIQMNEPHNIGICDSRSLAKKIYRFSPKNEVLLENEGIALKNYKLC
jgi:hypothetical protein